MVGRALRRWRFPTARERRPPAGRRRRTRASGRHPTARPEGPGATRRRRRRPLRPPRRPRARRRRRRPTRAPPWTARRATSVPATDPAVRSGRNTRLLPVPRTQTMTATRRQTAFAGLDPPRAWPPTLRAMRAERLELGL